MTNPLFILHLEDDPLDAELVSAALEAAGFLAEIVRVDNQADFEGAVQGVTQGLRPFDLVLADYNLPSFDGVSALEILRSQKLTTPFVFVSGELGEDLGIESLKKGATDYVLKHRLERLAPAVERALREAADRAEREKAEADRERLVRVIENSSDFIGIADMNGQALFINEAGRALIGISAHQVSQISVLDCFVAHERSRVASEILPQVLQKGRWAGEMQFRHFVTEEPIEVWWNVFLVRDGENRPISYATVTREIAEQKRAQATLAAALQKERTIAQTLQKSLLFDPPANAFPGLVLGTLYESAWDEAQIGGDFYDAFALEENKVALVVGDVTGKGLKAAAYTAEVKFTLRAFLREHSDPCRALERLNNFLVDAARLDAPIQQPRDAMVALALVVVDTISGACAFACAGSEPPLVLRANGDAHEIGARGLVLGANPKSEYEGETLTLDANDMVIMLTDGITEARRGRQFFDYDGMTQSAQAAQQGGVTELGEIGQRILGDAKAFAGGKLSDDACLLLIRRLLT